MFPFLLLKIETNLYVVISYTNLISVPHDKNQFITKSIHLVTISIRCYTKVPTLPTLIMGKLEYGLKNRSHRVFEIFRQLRSI